MADNSVNSIITKQLTNSEDAVTKADDFLVGLSDLIGTTVDDIGTLPTITGFTSYDESDAALEEAKAGKPAVPTIPELGITIPNAPNLSYFNVNKVSLPTAPTSPGINIPTAPTADAVTKPGKPEITQPNYPTTPTITYPETPSIVEADLPSAPTIDFGTFDEPLPTDLDNLTEPDKEFSFEEEALAYGVMSDVESRVSGDLSGGYGIEPDDELALWNRMQEREQEGMVALTTDLIDKEAQRGLARPSGAMFDSIDRARKEALSKISSANREIALKRSELYVANRQHAIEKAVNLSDIYVRYWSGKQERKLKAAQMTVELAIALFNAKVGLAQARLEKYKAAADVYKAVIQTEAVKVNVYEVQVRAALGKTEVEKLKVAIYESRLKALNTVIETYKVQMEAAEIASKIEALKIDIFRAEITAYAEEIRANTAKFQLFESQVRGELAKVNVYQADVQAYQATAQAKRIKADINIAEARADVEVQSQLLDSYRTQVQAADIKMRGDIAEVDALIKQYAAETSGYGQYMDALADLYRLGATNSNNNARTSVDYSRMQVESARLAIDKFVAESKISLGAATEGARVYARMVDGALSAINTVAAQIETSEAE